MAVLFSVPVILNIKTNVSLNVKCIFIRGEVSKGGLRSLFATKFNKLYTSHKLLATFNSFFFHKVMNSNVFWLSFMSHTNLLLSDVAHKVFATSRGGAESQISMLDCDWFKFKVKTQAYYEIDSWTI